MKRFIIVLGLLFGMLVAGTVVGQTQLYTENFELNSLPDSVTHTGSGVWGKSSTIFSQGALSDSSRIVNAGDTTVLTTLSFSSVGSSNVMLYFDHICKIEFFDEAYIEVSTNNGVSWTRLTGAQYLGTSQFANNSNKFTAAAYSTDWVAGTYAVPTNAWWKSETFNISTLAGNTPNVKIRFVLRDANPGSTMPDNYAWFIDNIRVVSLCANTLSGTYTIGGTNPDFINFNDAITSLNLCGITGPVTFNVAPGTYTEQLNLGTLQGASATNTVTFKSANNDSTAVILQFNASSNTNNYVVNLQGTSHVAFKNMTLKALNASFARVVVLGGNNTNVTLQGNILQGTQSVNTDSNQFVLHCVNGGLYDGINILGNRILNGRFGINFGSPAMPMTNVVIKYNYFFNQLNRPMNLNGLVGLDFGHNNLFSDATMTSNAGIFTTNLTGQWKFYNNTLINMAGVRVWEGWTYGGVAAGQEALVYNNYLYGSSTSSYVYDGGGAVNHIKFYHNTFVGNSTTRTVNFNNYYGANVNITFVNNIIQSTGQLLYFTANPTGLVINYNNFYTTSSGNWAYFWGTNATNLASIKTASAQNANSVAINPIFQGITDPHFTNFALKGLGTPIAQVTMDIDGQPRSTTAPDMGCDEFILYNDDAGIMAMLPATLCPGTANVSARLKNFGPNVLQSVTIHWSVDGVVQAPYNYMGSLASLGEVNIGVGIYNFLSSGTYALKFWTSLPNGNPDGNSANDTLAINNFKTSLTGTYTVGGASADFNTPTDAITALNTYGVCGPTLIEILPGTYYGRLTIGSIQGASSVNTITIKSQNNDTSAVIADSATSAANNWVVRMNGARYVTFKSITFAPKHLTFSNAMVFINSAQYNTVEGCLFLGVGSGSTVDLALLRNEDFNSKGNKILGNRFFKGSIGILMKGSSATSRLDSVYIYGNVIQQFSQRGIRVEYANAPIIDSNVVVSSSAVTEMHGVSLSYCYDAYQITRNSISLSNYSNLRGADLGNITSTATTWGLIANNFITLIGTASSTNCYGVRLYPNVYYTRVANNSLLVNTGNQHNDTRGINATTQCTNIEIINNNIVSNNFPCFNEGTAVTYSDYNNFFSTTNRYAYYPGSLQLFTSQAALAAAMQKDSNSISVNPYFVSNTDLHTNLGSLNGIAKPLSYVSIDIDGEPRSLTNPDIGADEFIPSPFDLEANAILQPSLTGCGYGTQETIILKIRNVGSSDVNGGFSASYQINNGTIITETITDTIIAGGFLDYSFISQADLSVGTATTDQVMQLKAWVSFTLDTFNPNDTTAKTIVSGYQPAPPTAPAPYASTYATSTIITATSPEMLMWYPTPVSVTPIFVGTLFTTPQLYDTTTFYVGARSSQGLQCVSALVPVTVNITGYPQQDAGIVSIDHPSGNIPSGVNHALKVTLKNYGLANLTSVMIPFSVNGITKDTLTWTGNLPHGATQQLDVDSFMLQGGVVTMKAWTTMPNNTADIYNFNDTSSITFNACMQGVFTIGPAGGPGTYDFNSFGDARNALVAAGVCGHVVFNVADGTYTEQINFSGVISGADFNATITFQSASNDSTAVVLQWNNQSSNNFVLKFSGAQHIHFRKMTLKTTGTTYGNIIDLTAQANYNSIRNCIIESIATTTAANANPIYLSGTKVGWNVFANNRMLNGYSGIRLYGSSSTNLAAGNQILNNEIINPYYYGMYLYYHDSILVQGNTITMSGTSTAYGIYAGYCQNTSKFENNVINMSSTGIKYGMYIYYCTGTASKKGLVANNFVSIAGAGTSTNYGMRIYYSNYQDVLFNSIHLANGSTTSHGLSLYYGGNNNVMNNNVKCSNGAFSYYVTVATSVNTSDYNNFFTTGGILGYWTANRNTLADLKNASGKDLNSLNINPVFTSTADLHLMNPTLATKGISHPRVTNDIDGEPRSIMPTIGADEVSLLGIDAGVSAVLTPGGTTNEYDTIHPTIIVCNYGVDTLFSIPLVYVINSGLPVIFTYTDTLAPNACDTVTLPYFLSPAGQSTICAYSQLSGDTNFYNDNTCKSFFGTPSFDAKLTRIFHIAGGCNLSNDTVKIVVKNNGALAITGNLTASYQVNGISPVVTQAISTFIPVNDSIQFTFNTLVNLAVTTTDSIFNIKAWVDLTGDNVQYNDTSETEVTSIHTPSSPMVTNVTIPYGTSTTLSVQSSDTLLWFAGPNDSIPIGQGAQFSTPVMYSNTTYWVQAYSGSLKSVAPGSFFMTEICHYKYTPGVPVNGWPSYLLADDYIEITGVPGSDLEGITLEQWDASSMLSSYTFPQGTVLSPGGTAVIAVGQLSSSVPVPSSFYYHGTGGYTGTFSSTIAAGRILKTPDGDILDAVAFGNYTFPASAGVTSADWTGTTQAVSGSGNRLIGAYTKNATNWINSSVSPQDPNMLNSGVTLPSPVPQGCSSAKVPLVVTVSNQQACDVGVTEILQPISAVNLGTLETVKVKVKNFGTSSQNNIPVSFQIDSQTPITETITATILTNDSLEFTFVTKANLGSVGNTYQIKAWSGLACDGTPQNDTAWKTVQNLFPSYCISTATSTGYEDLTNVTLHTLNNTSAPVGSMYTNFSATVAPPMLSPGVSYPISISSDFPPSYSYQYNCWVKAWIDFNRDGVFDPLTEEIFSSATTSSNTVTGTVNIPPTAMVGNTLMRVVFVETSAATSVNPCGTYTWGETEDYMVTINPLSTCDAGVIAILEPGGLQTAGAILPVYVKFMNFGSDTIQANTLSLSYEFNNGTPVVTNYANALPPMAQDSIYLPNITLNLGNNTLCVKTVLACDSVQFNNEQCISVFGQFQTAVPYFDNFETNNYWYKPGTSTNWQLGTPNANVINSAYSGTKAWVTNLTGDYSNNANDYLYSPQFNFSSLGASDTITLSFYHWADMAASDYGRIQYSKDGGINWSNLGFMNDPLGTNWYNTQAGGTHYFSLTNTGWQFSAFKLDPATFNTNDTIQFRFHFNSNASVTANGWAIDNFRLALPVVANDIGVTSIDYPLNDTAIGSQVNATVTITNFGTATQVMFPVVLKLNGATVGTEIWTGNLPSQATTQYSFILPFTVPGAAYQLCAQTQLVGDAYPVNDEKCRNFGVLPALNDVGISKIIDPLPDTLGYICFYNSMTPWAYSYPMTVRIRNYGQNTQTSIPVKYTWYSGGPVITDTWTGTLLPNDSVDYILVNPFQPKLGAQQVCVETSLTNDVVTNNNKACMSYSGIFCPVGIDDQLSGGLILHQNIPNPAAGTTAIRFEIPQDGSVRLAVVNLVGQTVFLTEQTFNVGEHQIDLDVTPLAAGVYQYFVEFNGYRLTRKMVVSR